MLLHFCFLFSCQGFEHDSCATFASETMPAAIPPYCSELHVLYPVVQVSEVEEKLTLPTTREWWWWGDYCCWSHRRWECAAAEGPVRRRPHLLKTTWRLNCWHAALLPSGISSALCPLHVGKPNGRGVICLFFTIALLVRTWGTGYVCLEVNNYK